ncbi:Na+/sulfate symporter, partial [human gut metagenome]
VFVLLANGKDTEPKAGRKKRWFALTLLVLMIVGATVGELPFMEELLPGIDLDMFFFVSCNDCDNGMDQTFSGT